MKFDKLNKLEADIDFDYFGPMAISAEDKARRRELAEFLTDAFLYFFSVYEVHQMHDSMLKKALYEQLLTDKISDAVSKVTGIDSFMSEHIRQVSKEVVDTTFKHADSDSQIGQTHINIPPEKEKVSDITTFDSLTASGEPLESPKYVTGDSLSEEEKREIDDQEDDVEDVMKDEAVHEYWLSIYRAINIARNEANTLLNYSDYLDAKDRGCTRKVWLTMLDDKVRETHDEVEGQSVGIDEFFQVGNSELRFPQDWMMAPDPKEVINCRCAVDYIKE